MNYENPSLTEAKKKLNFQSVVWFGRNHPFSVSPPTLQSQKMKITLKTIDKQMYTVECNLEETVRSLDFVRFLAHARTMI